MHSVGWCLWLLYCLVYYQLLILFLCCCLLSIAAEAICAGRDPNTNAIVLVHGQIIDGGNVAIKVRSQDAALSQRCLQIAVNALN